MDSTPTVVVRNYKGRNQRDASPAFQRDAEYWSKRGYYPVSQSWAPGSWGLGAYLVGVLLILAFGIGLLVLLYLIVVKPAGELTVAYRRTAPEGQASTGQRPPVSQ